MKTKLLLQPLFLLLLLPAAVSCKKDWLEKKSDLKLIIPATLQDMRLLLRDTYTLNTGYTSLGEVAADNYTITDAQWQSQSNLERNAYSWQSDLFGAATVVYEWDGPYKQVMTANVILEGLAKIEPGDSERQEWNDLKGEALYFRSKAFYDLLQLFAKPYDESAAAADPGIPLRLSSDIAAPVSRATVKECYNQITADLEEAAGLLNLTPAVKSDPSRPAALGFLARIYLIMGDYDQAYHYADECLKRYSTLLDYNDIDPASLSPFPAFNAETIFYDALQNYYILSQGAMVPGLYEAYEENDLRKKLFFQTTADDRHTFQGNYTGNSYQPFDGIATDEILLIRAECHARNGDPDAAMDDLNTLLEKRYESDSFIPVTATDADDALKKVLEERRKELVYRGLRWGDLRRLNADPEFAVTLSRTLNGEILTLPPGDPRYVFPIPDYIIESSGITQNPR